MALRRLQVSDFRCVQAATLTLDSKFTLIHGPNGSGKTSLLEAIYVLGRGRSFRTRHLDRLIRRGTAKFVVFGEVTDARHVITLGVEGSEIGIRAKVAGDRVATLADLAAAFPVQIMDPEVHRLIEEGPARRRRFLDWGVFHMEHSYIDDWQIYQRVLKQRNAALRARTSSSSINAWNADLIRLALSIDAARRRYVDRLTAFAVPTVYTLLRKELTLTYRSGWSRDKSFDQALTHSFLRDQEAGVTTVGPQRADLEIRLNGDVVKDRVSRGQQKLLAAALLLAQIRFFPHDETQGPTLLLDDPAAELDSERLQILIGEVLNHSVQLVVTSLTRHFQAFGVPGRRFEIVDGGVQEEHGL